MLGRAGARRDPGWIVDSTMHQYVGGIRAGRNGKLYEIVVPRVEQNECFAAASSCVTIVVSHSLSYVLKAFLRSPVSYSSYILNISTQVTSFASVFTDILIAT